MKKGSFFIILVAVLMLLVYIDLLAQEANEPANLIYLRQRSETGFQLVSLSAAGQQVFEIVQDDCYSLSPDAAFLAVSNPISDAIDVYRLADGENIRTILLENVQSSCGFRWQSETVLSFSGGPTTQTSAVETTIDILDGRMLSAGELLPSAPPSVTVPDLLADDFRLTSPDNSLIVYNRCAGSAFTTSALTGDQVCSSQEEVVIYDLRTQHVEQVLADTQQGRFVLDADERLAWSFGGISWSPSGRYLAYLTSPADANTPPLRIYDVREERSIDLVFAEGLEMVKLRGFVWSQDEQYLAFWVNDYVARSERLAVAEVETRQVRVSSTLVQPAPANWGRGLGHTVVFVDRENRLIEYQLSTGTTTILDTDVWDILSS
jgi:WD40 repeat protein